MFALISYRTHQVVEDLEALFVAYDEDDSGELDEKEVRELVEQLGSNMTDAEAAQLFKVHFPRTTTWQKCAAVPRRARI